MHGACLPDRLSHRRSVVASRDDEEHGHRPPRGWEAQAQHDGPYAGTAYGSGRWGSHAAQTPSGYGGPSGTGYDQTCPGQSGYGQAERDASHPVGGVSYAGTAGYAGYASTRHTRALTYSDAQRQRPDWDDIDYQQWRNEQLRKLDIDYQTWRQARYRKFADEFDAWRASRQDSSPEAPPTVPVRPADALSQPSSFQPQ
jgi:hypothetical protein